MATYTLDHLIEAWHMFSRHLKVKGKNFTRIKGNAKLICHTTLKKLYTGYFYRTSLGNYPHFYSRDFSMVVDALLKLGKRKEVVSTLKYALGQYKEFGGIKTFISVIGKPVDFPNVYSPDSTAYFFQALRQAGDKKLIEKNREFLQNEIDRFYVEVVDKTTGLPKKNKLFGAMRDHSKRSASCYDVVMCAVLSREATTLGFDNPLKDFDYQKILKEQYWTGTHFKDDDENDGVVADANIFPFWMGVIKDKKMLKTAMQTLIKEKLDEPFPIRYVSDTAKKGKMIAAELFVPNWESTAIWPMGGLPYIELLSQVDKKRAKKHIDKFTELIEHYGTFIEVYKKDGTPYSSAFFSADEGMIWCANYLKLRELLG